MFVDDDTRILSGIRRGLQALHDRWEMEFISNPGEAPAAFRQNLPKVVVTDMMMPSMMSGTDICRTSNVTETKELHQMIRSTVN